MTSLKQILKWVLMFMTMASLGLFQSAEVQTSKNNMTATATKAIQPAQVKMLAQAPANKSSVNSPITMVTTGSAVPKTTSSVPATTSKTTSSVQSATVTNPAVGPIVAPSKPTNFEKIKAIASKPAAQLTVGGAVSGAALANALKSSDEKESEASVSAPSQTNSLIIKKEPDLARRSSVKVPSSSSLVDMNKRAPSESLRSSGSGEFYNRPMASSNSTANGTNYNSNYYSDMGQSRRMDSNSKNIDSNPRRMDSTAKNMDGQSLIATKPQSNMASSTTNNMNNMNGMNGSKTMMIKTGSSMTPQTISLSPGVNQLKPNMDSKQDPLIQGQKQPLTVQTNSIGGAQSRMEKTLASGLEKKFKDNQELINNEKKEASLKLSQQKPLAEKVGTTKTNTTMTIPLQSAKPLVASSLENPVKMTQLAANIKKEPSLNIEKLDSTSILGSKERISFTKKFNDEKKGNGDGAKPVENLKESQNEFQKPESMISPDSSYLSATSSEYDKSKSKVLNASQASIKSEINGSKVNKNPNPTLKIDNSKNENSKINATSENITFSLVKESKDNTIQNTVDKPAEIKNTQNKSEIKKQLEVSSYQETEQEESYLQMK